MAVHLVERSECVMVALKGCVLVGVTVDATAGRKVDWSVVSKADLWASSTAVPRVAELAVYWADWTAEPSAARSVRLKVALSVGARACRLYFAWLTGRLHCWLSTWITRWYSRRLLTWSIRWLPAWLNGWLHRRLSGWTPTGLFGGLCRGLDRGLF